MLRPADRAYGHGAHGGNLSAGEAALLALAVQLEALGRRRGTASGGRRRAAAVSKESGILVTLKRLRDTIVTRNLLRVF
jgi:hypothetical protein